MFRPGGSVRVIAHRGGRGAAPENTLPAIRHGVEAGADAIEFDVRCTADGRIVVFHDRTVDRTTDGHGALADLSFEEARRLDAGFRFSPDRGASYPFRGRGIRISTLEEALAETADLPVVIEVKSMRSGAALGEWLRTRPERERILVGGFSREAVRPAALAARWRCATEKDLRPYVLLGKLGLRPGAPAGADALMVPERRHLVRIVSRRFVRRAHRDGLGVYVWTVNRPDRMRKLLDLEVDGVISDYPAVARRVVEERA